MLLGFSGFELTSKVEELGFPKQTTAIGLTVSAFVIVYYALRVYSWLTIRKAATKGPKAIPIALEGASLVAWIAYILIVILHFLDPGLS